MTPTHQTILENESQINILHRSIKTTFAHRDDSKECYQSWQNACDNFHQNYHSLVFSCDDYTGEEDLMMLLTQDSQCGLYAREFAICFIELRPYYFRSGYLYKRLLRKLKHAALTREQLERYYKIKKAYEQYCQSKINND